MCGVASLDLLEGSNISTLVSYLDQVRPHQTAAYGRSDCREIADGRTAVFKTD